MANSHTSLLEESSNKILTEQLESSTQFFNYYDFLDFTPDNFRLATLEKIHAVINTRKNPLASKSEDDLTEKESAELEKLIECEIIFKDEEAKDFYDEEFDEKFHHEEITLINNFEALYDWSVNLLMESLEDIQTIIEKRLKDPTLRKKALSKLASLLIISPQHFNEFINSIPGADKDFEHILKILEILFKTTSEFQHIKKSYLDCLLEDFDVENGAMSCLYLLNGYQEIFFKLTSSDTSPPIPLPVLVNPKALNIQEMLTRLENVFGSFPELKKQALDKLTQQTRFLEGVIHYHHYAVANKSDMGYEEIQESKTTKITKQHQYITDDSKKILKYTAPDVPLLITCLQSLPDKGDGIALAIMGNQELFNSVDLDDPFWNNFSAGITEYIKKRFIQSTIDLTTLYYKQTVEILRQYNNHNSDPAPKTLDKLWLCLFKSQENSDPCMAKNYLYLLEANASPICQLMIIWAILTNQNSQQLSEQVRNKITLDSLLKLLSSRLNQTHNRHFNSEELAGFKTTIVDPLNRQANKHVRDDQRLANFSNELSVISQLEHPRGNGLSA